LNKFQRVQGLFAGLLAAGLTFAGTPNLSDPEALRAAGGRYLAQGDLKRAIDVLERAASLDPASSRTYLLLGRAYGHRAETAFAVAAPALAVKARLNLEKAVALDPRNWDATDDLFEFYLEAPALLGGGNAKALVLADRIATHDAAEAARDRARVSEAEKQFDQAERGFRRAAELAPQQPSRLVDLARYLARRGRYSESDQIFAGVLAASPDTPRFLYARASMLIETNRNNREARRLLQKYLSMNLTEDDPSREVAERLLRKVSAD
jgi:tetratricopeptide (TPR) repeat protein